MSDREKIREHVKNVQELLKEIRGLKSARYLKENNWWLRLPRSVDQRTSTPIYFMPKDQSLAKAGKMPTPKQEKGKWVPAGTWIPEPVFYKFYFDMQMKGCEFRMQRIDAKYNPQIAIYEAEIAELKPKVEEIEDRHSRKELDNAGLQDQIEEYDRLMKDYLELEGGSEEDQHYLDLLAERDAIEGRKHDIGGDPDFRIPWPKTPGSKDKPVQDIKILLYRYKSKVRSLEKLRDREKEPWSDQKELNQEHWDKWNELDLLTRKGAK